LFDYIFLPLIRRDYDLLCSVLFSGTVGTVVTRARAALFCANNRQTRTAQHNNETGACYINPANPPLIN